jgi:Leucine-rich repeat (LRR) protein
LLYSSLESRHIQWGDTCSESAAFFEPPKPILLCSLAGRAAQATMLSPEPDENDSINRRIAEATKTKVLDLSGLRLTYNVPPEIFTLKYLRAVNLYKNLLETLPDEITRFQALEEVNLYRNRLTTVPRNLASLSGLKILNIGSNQIKFLAPQLFELKNLEELDVSNNQLRTLPPAIAKLTNLRDLKLFRNKLKSLPGEIGDLNQLRKLDLSFNQIVNLPSKFGNLTGLSFLSTLRFWNPSLHCLPTLFLLCFAIWIFYFIFPEYSTIYYIASCYLIRGNGVF